MLRIVAGRFRGRRLGAAPKSRPTGERVRAAIFNRLADEVVGARVLELYAGSGALALEALSRGARSCVCVERDRRALAAIRANVAELGVGEEVRCLSCNARRAGELLAARGDAFDLVLADPPYRESVGLDADSGVARAVAELAAQGRLSPDALVVVETGRLDGEPAPWSGFELEGRRSYGDTVVSYLRYNRGRQADEEEG